jgi:hypothetical protein
MLVGGQIWIKFWSKRTENVLYCFESNACGDIVGSNLEEIEIATHGGHIQTCSYYCPFLLMGKRMKEMGE